MRIINCIYADGCSMANTPSGEKVTIDNPKLIFAPLSIPGQLSFVIMFSFAGVDSSKEHSIMLHFKDPHGNIKLDTGSIAVAPNNSVKLGGLPMEWKGGFMSLDVRNFTFEEEGEYSTEIFIDGSNLGEFPIYVITAVPQ